MSLYRQWRIALLIMVTGLVSTGCARKVADPQQAAVMAQKFVASHPRIQQQTGPIESVRGISISSTTQGNRFLRLFAPVRFGTTRVKMSWRVTGERGLAVVNTTYESRDTGWERIAWSLAR